MTEMSEALEKIREYTSSLMGHERCAHILITVSPDGALGLVTNLATDGWTLDMLAAASKALKEKMG